jgi:hypothetical protein
VPAVNPVAGKLVAVFTAAIETVFQTLPACEVILARSETVTEFLTRYAVPNSLD